MTDFKIGDRVVFIPNDSSGVVVEIHPGSEVGITDFSNKIFTIVTKGKSLTVSFDKGTVMSTNPERIRPFLVEYFRSEV